MQHLAQQGFRLMLDLFEQNFLRAHGLIISCLLAAGNTGAAASRPGGSNRRRAERPDVFETELTQRANGLHV